MKKKETNRKTKARSHKVKRRGNSRYVVFYLFICLTIFAALSTAYHFAKKMDYFLIESITITGNKNLNSSFMNEMAQEFIGHNLFSLNRQSLIIKYENIVRIKRVRVRKILPNRLRIDIQEREGFLYIKTTEGHLVPIDEDMVILDNTGFYLSENLPVVDTGYSVETLTAGSALDSEYLTLIMKIHNIIRESRIDAGHISEYYMKKDNLYLVEANTGARICIGQGNFNDKLKKLEFIWNNVGIEKHTLINLRYRNQVVFSPM